MPYIEIMGVMGTGKSSLAKVFNEKAGYTAILEKEEDLQRLFFVEQYLGNPEKYGFVGGLNFTAFHLNRMLEEMDGAPAERTVVDTSLLMQYAYAKGITTPREMAAITEAIRLSYEHLPRIDLRIVTHLPIDEHVARIAARGRESEKSVPRAFLEATQRNIEEAIRDLGDGVPTLFLDSSKIDWVGSEAGKQQVMNIVAAKLAENGPKNRL